MRYRTPNVSVMKAPESDWQRMSSAWATLNRVAPRSVITCHSVGSPSDTDSMLLITGRNSREASSASSMARTAGSITVSVSIQTSSLPSAAIRATASFGAEMGKARSTSTSAWRWPRASTQSSLPCDFRSSRHWSVVGKSVVSGSIFVGSSIQNPCVARRLRHRQLLARRLLFGRCRAWHRHRWRPRVHRACRFQ